MRADWGEYGLPVHTPNLDALARRSLLFEHAYCQCALPPLPPQPGRLPVTARMRLCCGLAQAVGLRAEQNVVHDIPSS